MSLIRMLLKTPIKCKRSTNIINSNKYLTFLRYTSSTTTSKNVENEEEQDKPIPYTTSPANKWHAKSSRIGTDAERLSYEPWVVISSIAIFMIYFCILREESDIDKEFEKTLYNRIPGLEEHQLIVALEYNREHNLETKAIEDRLNELVKKK